jgi:lysyl-tRNA synthetase class 2
MRQVRTLAASDHLSAFRPNATVRGLLTGEFPSGAIVSIAGRLVRQQGRALQLSDERLQLSVELATAIDTLPNQFAWIGVQGHWDQGTQRVLRAELVFWQEPDMNVAEAAACKLPEVKFLTERWRLEAIGKRARLLRFVREFMEAHRFVEVQTPMLRAAPEVAYLEQCATLGTNNQTLYLRTDPEEYLKRYLTIGLEAVYEISTNVRAEQADRDHLQEFTTLECYRRFGTLSDSIETCSELIVGALNSLGTGTATFLHGQAVDLTPPLPVRSYAEILLTCGLDIEQYPTAAGLARQIRERGWWEGTGGPLDQFRRTWLEWLLTNRIQPLIDRPTFVTEFPIELALSYQACIDRPAICQRGELYLPGGFELAHVYEIMTEARQIRERYEERLRYRVTGGLPAVALDEGLIGSAALGMPPMSGLALGLDRLLLLVLGKGIIGDGLLFPREGFNEDEL